jgi:fumarylacetoacetase
VAHADGGGRDLTGGKAFGIVGGRVAIRDGDEVLLPEVADAELAAALAAPELNPLIGLGSDAWRAALEADGSRVPLSACEPSLPLRVRDYVDFYASEEHATNFARIFRPGKPPLAENWRHMPVGYHGRTSSIVVSGTPVKRPSGVRGPGDFGPSVALDFECELGFLCASAEELFGVVLLNDWSARDIQRFEYQPLGPFLGKAFATSISAWVVPVSELPRVEPRPQDPPPAPHLRDVPGSAALDIDLEIELNGEVISRPGSSSLYWTPEQMLAHLASSTPVGPGDLFGSGTISGARKGTDPLLAREGSLAEIARGERWLADGDEVVMRGAGLAEVRGRVHK